MKAQCALAMAMAFGMMAAGCGSSSPQPGAGGSPGKTGGTTGTGGSGSGGASDKGGTPGGNGGSQGKGGTTTANGGSGGGAGGSTGACPDAKNVTPCGGDVTGSWTVSSACLNVTGQFDLSSFGIGDTNHPCPTATINSGSLQVTGTWAVGSDSKVNDGTTTTGHVVFALPQACLFVSGTTTNCESLSKSLASPLGFDAVACTKAGDGCSCDGTMNQSGSIGFISTDPQKTGKVTTANNTLTYPDDTKYSYCVAGSKLTLSPQSTNPTLTGSIVLTSGSTPGTGGTGGGQGGKTGTAPLGGNVGSGGAAGGAAGGAGGASPPPGEYPCDIFAAAATPTPCVAAYSMVRKLSKSYSGALYQVRAGSSSTNTGTGGTTKDIGMTTDGYADVATQDTFCKDTVCTVSLLYDQTGNGSNLPRAPKGLAGNGARTGEDCYEASATKGTVTINGHQVHPLYMNQYECYRTPVGVVGKKMPLKAEAEGIYELVDGTHYGTACCWDFGNVTTDPTKYGMMNTLFFGTAYWGNGAGNGPWVMADFEAGVWAGGSVKGDPGWGGLSDQHPSNPKNPSLKVPFAIGFLKTGSGKWALRMADIQTATDLTTAYEGNLPPDRGTSNLGGITLGTGGDNSNNSYGTFYEGAIVAGYPSNDTELAIMKNIKAAGYTK